MQEALTQEAPTTAHRSYERHQGKLVPVVPNPEGGSIKFFDSLPDGLKFASSLVVKLPSGERPTRERCVAEIHPALRPDICGMKDPATAKPLCSSGVDDVYVLDLYREHPVLHS